MVLFKGGGEDLQTRGIHDPSWGAKRIKDKIGLQMGETTARMHISNFIFDIDTGCAFSGLLRYMSNIGKFFQQMNYIVAEKKEPCC